MKKRPLDKKPSHLRPRPTLDTVTGGHDPRPDPTLILEGTPLPA